MVQHEGLQSTVCAASAGSPRLGQPWPRHLHRPPPSQYDHRDNGGAGLVGRNTITRVERGDAGVALGIYATVLFVLGLADRLGTLADPATDQVGLTLAEEQLPKRVRAPAEAR